MTIQIKTTATVKRKVWAPGDTYLEIEFQQQVFEEEGWREGEVIDVLITKRQGFTKK